MKLDPSIIALKDFESIKVFWLKLARYSTAGKAPSLNASEWTLLQHGTQLSVSFTTYMNVKTNDDDIKSKIQRANSIKNSTPANWGAAYLGSLLWTRIDKNAQILVHSAA